MKYLIFLLLCISLNSSLAQDKSNDILLVNANQRFIGASADTDTLSQISGADLAIEYIQEYLQGALLLTDDFSEMGVDRISSPTANSLADLYYDPVHASLRNTISEGYKYVIFFDSEQAYAYPEMMYEACTKFSDMVLAAGGTPMLMMYRSDYVDTETLGATTYRAGNGSGLEVIPGGYGLQVANLEGRQIAVHRAEQAMLLAGSIIKKITDLNPEDLNYIPQYEHTTLFTEYNFSTDSSFSINDLMSIGAEAVNVHNQTTHYDTSYENDGAVVYRTIDLSTTQFNNDVRYYFKGTSTHDFTRDRMNLIINESLTPVVTKFGRLNNDSRFWTDADRQDRAATLSNANHANRGIFFYASGTTVNADAQDLIDLNGDDLVPFVFDWIKAFEGVGGVTATTNALNNEDCTDLWFNYHFRGWKTIPLTVGMGRLNEAFNNFPASQDDGGHISDPLIYMNSSMMLASALGTELPVPDGLTTRRGNWSQAQLETAISIGHDLIKELAHMSETLDFIPDSNLSILMNSLSIVTSNAPYSHQLLATGGSAPYSWKSIADTPLPDGLTLSNDGVISGIATESFGIQNVAFQVTDSNGAFRKVGLRMQSGPPTATDLSFSVFSGVSHGIVLPIDEVNPSNLSYSNTNPPNGTLTGTAPNLIYLPDEGTDDDSFTYTITDQNGNTTEATVNISIVTIDNIIYQDRFNNDGLETNVNIGGGVATASTANGIWDETANGLTYNAANDSGGNRATAYSLNDFDLSNGFTLQVDYTFSSLDISSGNNQLSFGVTSNYTPAAENPFQTDNQGTNLIGFNLSAEDPTLQGLIAKGNNGALEELSEFVTDAGAHTLTLTATPNGIGGANWSYSYDGEVSISGTLDSFDFTTNNFQFVTHGRDNVATKSIQFVQLQTTSENGFNQWISSFGIDEEDSTLFESNLDSDGIENILEYVLNGNPTSSDTDILPTLVRDGQNFAFHFTRRAESTEDIIQIFQYSTDLIIWNDISLNNDAAPEVNINDEVNDAAPEVNTEEVEVLFDPDITENGKIFGRLMVSPR